MYTDLVLTETPLSPLFLNSTPTSRPSDFQGIPSTVANGTRAEMFCSYQQGIQPTEPLWWERGYPGVKVRDGQTRGGERYEVSGNFVNGKNNMNLPGEVKNQLFRSHDWLSANQGPLFPSSVGSWVRRYTAIATLSDV